MPRIVDNIKLELASTLKTNLEDALRMDVSAWYDRFFPGRLVTTEESGNLSKDADALIARHFS